MALPASGPIGMSAIRTEIDNAGKASNLSLTLLGSMSGSGATRTSGYVALNQSSTNKPSPPFPASIGEWYSYVHGQSKGCGNSLNFTLGGYYTYAKYLITGENGSISTTTMYLPTSPGGNTIKCYIYNTTTLRQNDMPFNDAGGLTLNTPSFDGTFTTTTPQTYSHTFTSGAPSRSLYIVAWDNSVSPGSYDFVVSPSCGIIGTTTTTTTTSTTTTTTTLPPTTTSTTTTTTTLPPTTTTTTTSTTTTTTTLPPTTTTTTTSTTTTTTTPPPTTTSTTTTTTTPPPTTTSTTTTTTTLPPTTTSTTTTTTTLPPITTSTTTTTTTAVVPITFTATPSCVDGVGQIVVTNYAGGNGNYQWIAISGISRSDAAFQVASGTRFAAGSSFTFSSLANGNYWVALRDTANNTGITNDPGININCIPITTTSTTTTTTTSLPTTTTTTTSTTTTTTTAATINCGGTVNFNGASIYPYTTNVTLGTNTGEVTLTYDAQTIPDWFIVQYNSSIVVNTGYRGGSDYDFGGFNRPSFRTSLQGRIDPIYNTTYPDLTNYPDDGYPRVTSPGTGIATFNKSTTTPTTATFQVYAPGSSTLWSATLSCPVTTTTSTTTTTTTVTPSTFFIRGINCADANDARLFSYSDGPLNNGDVIQIDSGANIGCWTLSTTKPGTGANGSITGLWSIIAGCGSCGI